MTGAHSGHAFLWQTALNWKNIGNPVFCDRFWTGKSVCQNLPSQTKSIYKVQCLVDHIQPWNLAATCERPVFKYQIAYHKTFEQILHDKLLCNELTQLSIWMSSLAAFSESSPYNLANIFWIYKLITVASINEVIQYFYQKSSYYLCTNTSDSSTLGIERKSCRVGKEGWWSLI